MWLDPLLVPDLVNSLCLRVKVCSHLSHSTFTCQSPSKGFHCNSFAKLKQEVIYSSDRYHRFGIAVDKFTVYKSWAQGNGLALQLTMCSWGYVWQSQRHNSYQKGVPSWGVSEVKARQLSHQVRYLLGSSSQREFSGARFYTSENLLARWRGGTKSIIVCRLALGMECRVVRSRTWQFNTPSEQVSSYVLRGQMFFIRSNLWLRSLRCTPQIPWFTVMGYPPLLLSDKRSLC